MESLLLDTVRDCVGAACEKLVQAVSDNSTTCNLSYFGTVDWKIYNGSNQYEENDCTALVLNPFSFFVGANLLHYSNLRMCCNVSGTLFKPFCVSLLPFCVFYTWIRLLISIFNEIYLYHKRIKVNISQLLNKEMNQMLKDEIKDFYRVLRISYIIDLVNALISLWFFKGLQFYASEMYPYNAYTLEDPPKPGCDVSQDDRNCKILSDGLCLLHPRDSVLTVGVIIWFVGEATALWIQNFAVSSLTNIESYRMQGRSFYRKHRNFALYWSILFLLIGGIVLGLNFSDAIQFQDLKIYYKYYSQATLTFWLCYSVVLMLLFVDRYLTYDGFRKRKALPQNKAAWFDYKAALKYYGDQIDPNSIQIELPQHFQDQPLLLQNNAEGKIAAEEIKTVYLTKLKEHIEEVRRMAGGFNIQVNYRISMDYIGYLIAYNFFNSIGYIFMLVPYYLYQSYDTPDDSEKFEIQLTFHLIGFTITSLSTFAYELSHNFLFYKSFFGPVSDYWKRSNE